MRPVVRKRILIAIVLILGALFVGKFAGPRLLQLYIRSGMGDCKDLPITCMAPSVELDNPYFSKAKLQDFTYFKFKNIEISLPKGFSVVRGQIKKHFYKKRIVPEGRQTIYLLYQRPDFFVDLFPIARKHGVLNDYEFVRRTMYARTQEIENITDTFFVVMKGVFTPYLGEQQNLTMLKVRIGNKRGFINFDLSSQANYYDCTIVDDNKDFFKIYIKDTNRVLSLEDVLAIISTVGKPLNNPGPEIT
ncbi:MAG: hypothetical protein NTY47_08735 [Candidatus Omnitrophica bacterium]|nr:hypothetical protein [Candidatus Omnitrophota bacterium]